LDDKNFAHYFEKSEEYNFVWLLQEEVTGLDQGVNVQINLLDATGLEIGSV